MKLTLPKLSYLKRFLFFILTFIFSVGYSQSLTHAGSIVNGANAALLGNPTSVFVSGNYAYVVNYSSGENGFEIVDISNPLMPLHKGSIKDGVGGAALPNPISCYVQGNYAYVLNSSNSLEILDITNPANPVHNRSLALANFAFASSLFVQGNYVYITGLYTSGNVAACNSQNALIIVDISNPSAPKQVGVIRTVCGSTTPGPLLLGAASVFVIGNYAYVANSQSNNLEIIDVSIPAAPTSIGRIVDGSNGASLIGANFVRVSGNYAYVLGQNYLEIIDISRPVSPQHKGKLNLGGNAGTTNNLFISGNYIYLYRGGLSVIDVSDPTNPTVKSSATNPKYNLIGGSPTENGPVYVQNNYLYIGNSGLAVVDISNPITPIPKTIITDQGALLKSPVSVYVNNGVAYVANSNSFEAIDVSTPSAPIHKSSVSYNPKNLLGDFGNGLVDMVVKDNYAFLSSSGSVNTTSPIINITNPMTLAGNSSSIGLLKVSGNFLYSVGGLYGFRISDISNPQQPVSYSNSLNGLIGSNPGVAIQGPSAIDVNGNYAYLTTNNGSVFLVVDVTNPSSVKVIGSLLGSFGGAAIYATTKYAYVVGYNLFSVVDISNPAIPVLKASISNGTGGAILNYATSIFVSGNYAFIANSAGNSIEVIDVSNPASPNHLTNITDGDGGALLNRPNKLFVSGNYIYVASTGSNALEILKFTAPAPTLSVNQSSTNISSGSTYDFGNVNMLSNSAGIIYTVKNTGTAPLNIDLASSTITGANPSDFTVDLSALTTAIAPGTSSQAKVTFTPSASGSRSAVITVVSNDPNSPFVLNVKGTGVAASPVLSIIQGTTTIATNGTYDFGNVNMLSNSGSISFNVQNNGNAALAVDQINSSVTGANASDFALDLSALGASISPGSAGIVKVVFTPSASGLRTATVSVISNDPASPYIVNLKGTGVKIDQTITFGALPAKSVTDAPFTLAATSTSKLGVSYTSSNAAVAIISGNTVTIVGAGTSTITASQAGDGNYNAATPVTQTLTVTAQQSQSIAFATLPAKTFGDPAFILSATGGASGLPVTFASSNTSVATVSGTTVTIVGAGTTTITASQAGNANFLAAADVPQTLTVNKASQTITFANLPAKNVGDPPFTLTVTGGASGLPITFTSSNTGVATISGNTVTIVGAGTTTITASQAGNANYNAATSVTQTLTVNAKQNQTITFTALADVTVGASFSLTATASSGLAVNYTTNTSKATITGTTVTTIKAGRDTIIATQPGNSSFNAATPVSQSFCIKPAKPTITLSNGNTATVTLTSSATSGNQWYLNGTAITGATNATLSVTAAGVYKVQAKADDCVSDFSADQAIIVTGDLLPSASTVSISPNPVEGVLQLNGIVGEIKSNQLFDMTGRASSPLTLEKKNDVYQASVEHLSHGVYLLRVQQENKVVQIKFVKK